MLLNSNLHVNYMFFNSNKPNGKEIHMAITIAVANQKGGVGKTTSTIELAACLKEQGYNVLAVDLDQQSNLTRYISANPKEKGIYNVLKEEISATDAIQHTDEFDILSASEELSKADKEFGEAVDVLKLRKVLKSVNDIYDFILIDNNPSRNVLLNMTYIAADYIIIPAEAEEGSIIGIQAVFKDLKTYTDAEWSDAEVLGVILTKYEKTSMHEYGEQKIKEALENENSDAFLLRVRKSIVANECKSEGSSMQSGKKYSNPAMDYRKIGQEIIQRVIGA